MKTDGKIGGIFDFWLIFRAVVSFVVATAISILIFAVVMYFTESGFEYTAIFGTVCVAFGILISAFLTAKKIGKKGFLVGLITSITVFILVTLISLIIDKGAPTVNTLFHLIIYTLSGLIGGILGVNKGNNKKYI